jgi:DNA polymerase III alpha subunit (gram-positive type)
MLKDQKFLDYALLNITEKIQQILEENNEKLETQKLLQAIKEKLTKSFQEEPISKSEKAINSVEELVAQRKEVSEMVDFLVKSFPLKSKKLLKEVQELKKLTKNLSLGEKYYNILARIKYIFPKPHAIAYTTTAWRTAYYKVYHPVEFYSVLLTYHAVVHDIWLMTWEPKTINFRIEKLFESIGKAKNSEKELLSILKVLKELNKEITTQSKNAESQTKDYLSQKKTEIDLILEQLKQKILAELEMPLEGTNEDEASLNQNNKKKILSTTLLSQLNLSESEKKRIGNNSLARGSKINSSNRWTSQEWKLTTKEKELLHTLKIVLEMKQKNLDFRLGVDFNRSTIKNFQITNGQILIPFSAIAGIGEVVAKKITDYRQQKGKITNWKEELRGILNINHIQQLENLEKYNLLINGLNGE